MQALSLAEAKLALSGLSLDDLGLLGIDVLAAQQTLALGFQPLPALKLNYKGADGKPLNDWPRAKPFYRLRYLAQANDFLQLTDAKPVRYTQAPNTVCCAYFPQNYLVEGKLGWSGLIKNPDLPLLITEGELKAISACDHGFPCLGLGGVYNWRSLGKGVEFLPELEAINWVRRYVYLCFDSDYQTNPMVCMALRDLADALQDRGAYVHVVTLPALTSEDSKDGTPLKTGLDDYLVAEGPAGLEQLLHLAPALGLTKPLFDFNEKYIYIRSPGLVLDQRTQTKAAPSALKEHLESARTYQERIVKPDGSLGVKLVSAAGAWLTWPLRSEAQQLTYRPGRERRLLPENHYNSWPGWGCVPKKGSIKPFQELLAHLFSGAEPASQAWFERWLAYPLQHPGTKLFSSAVIHGVRHGTGKSLVGYTMKRIYGQNFTEISQADLHANFNEWAEAKQFILGDDVTGSNKRADADLLKKLITQSELRVNAKYIPSYTLPDCLNYLFTSNHPDAFFLEDDDRRFFIHEVVVGPLGDDFYRGYAGSPTHPGWLDHGGAAAVFDYLLKLDLAGFNPSAPALKTEARARMISDVQSDLGGWVRQLLATPDATLILGDMKLTKDLFTNHELLQLYDPMGKTGTTANGLGRELRRAGVQQVCGGKPLRLADGSQARYYTIRNVARWLSAAPLACVNHVLGEAPASKPVKRSKF